METEFSFASVGNLPIGLDGLQAFVSPLNIRVYNADTEEELKGVVVCDAQAGWIVQHPLRNGSPYLTSNKKGIVSERISGNFAIVINHA